MGLLHKTIQKVNLNQPITNAMVSEPVWKILVMDKVGQDVISPLLPIKVLRELGVTLHLLIGSKREALTDVPAVYFVSPTDENIDLLCEDLRRAMYDSFYINLISPLSRARLENLATAAVQGGAIGQVQKVVDQYLNFISLEDDLFVLRRYSENSPMSYFAINDPSTSDEQMTALIDSVADRIIRCLCYHGNRANYSRLDQKLRDNLRDARNNLFTVESVRAGQLNASRPLLLIADRSADLATMLHHTWTYQALIHDVLEELDEQINFLKERNVDESAIRFVQKMRSVSQLGKTAPPEEHHGAGTKTISMFNKLLSHSSRFVMEGVKNLVPKKHNLPLTMMVDSLVTPPSSSTVGINQMMGATQTNESDELCYLDPKVMHALSRDTSSVARAKQPPPQDVILFVIGGGNYVEYQNLVDYGKLKNLQRVTYGCTELVNPRQFTDQVSSECEVFLEEVSGWSLFVQTSVVTANHRV
ncbi:Sec1 family protein [Oesophagostomum dentatum]|uniref:Sec1 family protein n=1 Tax=Oesophagostomum dentatum TaxID=61180 RepID=A0A0B1T391_OESDE|nr:Sec1 family protein [Oesophagostomum dentatum]